MLEKEPPEFECYDEETDAWTSCTKAHICNHGIPKDKYRPVESQEEYIDNWVGQYDLLCEPKWRIGLIGSLYYAGVITTIILVTWLSDKYGRKTIVLVNYFLFMIVVVGIMIAHDLITLYILIFICGATFGGRVVVSINFVMEFI